MEHTNKEFYLELNESPELFAETDFLLRSGVHIQDHKSQSRYFRFIESNYPDLKKYYESLFNIDVVPQETVAGKYYFLEYFDEQKSRTLSKTKKNLDQKVTLFAIFLYTIYKTELKFSSRLTKQDILEVINSSNNYKPNIHRILLGSEQAETEITDTTILKWISTSLNEIEKLAWVYFPNNSDEDSFEIMPAFERIAKIYVDTINNIDSIKISLEE
jgi:hypothetical protein